MVAGNHALYLVKILCGHILMLCKSCDKGRQGTFKFLLNQFVNLIRLGFILGNERGNGTVVVLQYTTFSQTFENGIGRSPFRGNYISVSDNTSPVTSSNSDAHSESQ